MAQQTVDFKMGRGNEGSIATTAPYNIRGAAEGYTASVFLPYGAGVVFDPADATRTKIMLPTAAGQIFAGVVAATNRHGGTLDQFMDPTNAIFGIPAGESVGLLQTGDIFVWSETPVTRGSAANLRHTAAAAPNNRTGRWSATAGATLLALGSVGVLWNDNTTGPGIARLSLSTNQTRIN
jgi:hypothetical protein